MAQLAGMPTAVTNKASALLKELESQRGDHSQTAQTLSNQTQLAIFEMEDPRWNKVKQQVSQLDVNQMTPLEALNFIAELKKEALKN